ncbi:MAG: L-seryl-tRNA(Sec) selenium transferase [Myxococcota bacterium]|nr:L-seryl-tRNA(Sec) selenium transferase [Myxococcota bacterium]
MSLEHLPSISRVLADPRLESFAHSVAVRAAREVVDETRAVVRSGGEIPEDLVAHVVQRAQQLRTRTLRRVINGTGVVLHTNLGRAPLAPAAVEALVEVARGYSNVELNLRSGRRGERLAGCGPLLCELTGAEAALAVNNNAAAVLLSLTALARDREVLVSRGELVEIGGSFRVPDVVTAGGARLIEVGTTNRTRVEDYARAITERSAVILRVHRSNFRQVGFTEAPTRAELVKLAGDRNLVLVEDLGSGALCWNGVQGPAEPSEDAVESAVRAGTDVVCFSCDKLLGGPQGGVLVGRNEVIARLRAHAMYRALRLGKLSLAALEATLQLYREQRFGEIPARQMLERDVEQCAEIAHHIAAHVPGSEVEQDHSSPGGGSLPGVELATAVVVVRDGDPDALAARLREGKPPILARVARDALVLDPRTLLRGEEQEVIDRLCHLVSEGRVSE